MDHSHGYLGCWDYVGWGTILNRLAVIYPALVAVNIDDFVDTVLTVYNQSYVVSSRGGGGGTPRCRSGREGREGHPRAH